MKAREVVEMAEEFVKAKPKVAMLVAVVCAVGWALCALSHFAR